MAEEGRLHEPAVLERQVRRMLADPRSTALVDNFASQWLQLDRLGGVQPDFEVFFEFDENLRADMEQETKLFLRSQLREDRSLMGLLTADYTFVNERLARHYGIAGVYGERFRRVTLGGARPSGTARACQSADAHRLPHPNLPRPARQVAAGQHPGHAAAPAAARRAGPGGGPPRARRADDPRADGAAPGESGLRGVPPDDGPPGLRARELRRDRAVADHERRPARRSMRRARSSTAASCKAP